MPCSVSHKAVCASAHRATRERTVQMSSAWVEVYQTALPIPPSISDAMSAKASFTSNMLLAEMSLPTLPAPVVYPVAAITMLSATLRSTSSPNEILAKLRPCSPKSSANHGGRAAGLLRVSEACSEHVMSCDAMRCVRGE